MGAARGSVIMEDKAEEYKGKEKMVVLFLGMESMIMLREEELIAPNFGAARL